MTDSPPSAGAVLLDGGDAEVKRRLSALFRTQPRQGLWLTAPAEAAVDDIGSFCGWVTALADYPLPRYFSAEGVLGARSLALMLLSDVAAIHPQTAVCEAWRKLPGLMTLLHRRLLPAAASAVVFGGRDLLGALRADGAVIADPQPHAVVAALLENTDANAAGALAAAARAARGLPFAEALDFELWFQRPAEPSS